MRLYVKNNEEYIKELEEYIERLEHEEDRLRKLLLNRDNAIENIRKQLDYLETFSSIEDVIEDMKRRLNNIEEIVIDIDK